MELQELCNKTMELFEISNIADLGNALMNYVKRNDVQKYADFQTTELKKEKSMEFLGR